MARTVSVPVGGSLVVKNDRVLTDDPPPEAEQHDPGNLEDEKSAEVALNEVLSQLGEDESGKTNCMVWRVAMPPDDEDAYLYQTSARDFAARGGIDEIAKRYGPGVYRIRVYGKGRGIITHKRLKIGAPIIQEKQPGEDMAVLRSEVNAQFGALTAILEKLANPPQPAQPPLSPLEMLKQMAELKNLLGGDTKPASAVATLKDAASLLQTVRDLAGEAGGKEPGMGAVMMKLADKYLPEILPVIKKEMEGAGARQDAGAQPGAVLAHGTAPAPASLPATETQDVNAIRTMQFKMALDFLIDSAVRNLPPETYADVAVDKVPAADLAGLLNRDDWLAALANFDNRVRSHEIWFSKLRARILEILVEQGVLKPVEPLTPAGEPAKLKEEPQASTT